MYNGNMKTSDEDNIKNTLINPFYAVSLADHLFANNETTLPKEDWVLVNTKLISEMGAEDWLEELLVALTTEPEDSPTYTIISPHQVVLFSKNLIGKHDAIVDTNDWIQANVKLIDELGKEDWLWRLLDVLESGGATV